MEHCSGNAGYIKLKAIEGMYYVGVDSEDTTKIKLHTSFSDYTMWKLETTESGYLIFKNKATESTNAVLAPSVNSNSNGVNLTQIAYSNNTDYSDEWSLCKHFLFLYHYYDKGFEAKLSTLNITPTDAINNYNRVVEKRFLDIFGLALFSETIEYKKSCIDDCKNESGGTNAISITQNCLHDSPHDPTAKLREHFNTEITNNYSAVSATIIWTGHKMKDEEASNTFTGNDSVIITPTFVANINNLQDFEKRYTNSLMHELSHVLDTVDHYCKGDGNTNCGMDTCDIHGTPQLTSIRCCLTGNIYGEQDISIISNEEIYCDDCDTIILSHLNDHHVLTD